MNILILEDEEYRIAKFKENFIGCNLNITKNPQEANQWITDNQYDYIFLDCDLAPEHYNPSSWTTTDGSEFDSSTGVCTAKFLYNNPHKNSEAIVIIHSMNSVGSKRMYDYCVDRNAMRIPYYQLWSKITLI